MLNALPCYAITFVKVNYSESLASGLISNKLVMSMPNVFSEFVLRSGIRYRNLQDQFFTTSEKEWLCDAISTKPYLPLRQLDRNVTLY
jgi:hypothetical protein